MTPEQMVLVRGSWQRLSPFHTQVLALFYSRLFEVDPKLLKAIELPPNRLAALIDTALSDLEHPESLSGILSAAGRDYASLGIRDEDYTRVGEAFLWTLKQALQGRFTPATGEAWASAYKTFAALVQQGAVDARAPRRGRLLGLFTLRRAS